MNQQYLWHDHAKKKKKAGVKGRAVRWINGEVGIPRTIIVCGFKPYTIARPVSTSYDSSLSRTTALHITAPSTLDLCPRWVQHSLRENIRLGHINKNNEAVYDRNSINQNTSNNGQPSRKKTSTKQSTNQSTSQPLSTNTSTRPSHKLGSCQTCRWRRKNEHRLPTTRGRTTKATTE